VTALAGSSSERLAVVLVLAACLLPFAGKAFHIDDPMYLWAAQHIQEHPLDFYGFDVNWYGFPTAMAETNKNPPLVSYYLAGVALLVGWGEVPIHLAMFALALALALGCYALASRLTQSALLAALAACLTPAVVVSATTVMSDILMLALWCWAIVLWIDGLAGPSRARLLAAAILAGLCPLAKYFGISALPLMVLYALAHERRVGAWTLYLLVPLAMVAAYHVLTYHLYGELPLLDVADYATGARGVAAIGVAERALIGLAFLGGGLLTGLLFAPWLWPRRALWAGASVLLLVAFAVLQLETLGSLRLREAGATRVLAAVEVACFVGAALNLGALAVDDLYRRRDAGALLLAGWLLGVFAFASFLNWSTNVRSILPAAPAAGVLVARGLERRGSTSAPAARAALALPLVAGALLSVGVSWADQRLAEAARRAAVQLSSKHAKPGAALWFQGAWGFQWYMEAQGAKRIDYDSSLLLPGDVVIVPEYNTQVRPMSPRAVVQLETADFPTLPWLASLSHPVGAGFYTDVYGPLPWGLGAVPPKRYYVFGVHRRILYRQGRAISRGAGSRASGPALPELLPHGLEVAREPLLRLLPQLAGAVERPVHGAVQIGAQSLQPLVSARALDAVADRDGHVGELVTQRDEDVVERDQADQRALLDDGNAPDFAVEHEARDLLERGVGADRHDRLAHQLAGREQRQLSFRSGRAPHHVAIRDDPDRAPVHVRDDDAADHLGSHQPRDFRAGGGRRHGRDVLQEVLPRAARVGLLLATAGGLDRPHVAAGLAHDGTRDQRELVCEQRHDVVGRDHADQVSICIDDREASQPVLGQCSDRLAQGPVLRNRDNGLVHQLVHALHVGIEAALGDGQGQVAIGDDSDRRAVLRDDHGPDVPGLHQHGGLAHVPIGPHGDELPAAVLAC
jgi:4-amino-4-deoxy-L-arabinose transferase-like glycosyltransferase